MGVFSLTRGGVGLRLVTELDWRSTRLGCDLGKEIGFRQSASIGARRRTTPGGAAGLRSGMGWAGGAAARARGAGRGSGPRGVGAGPVGVGFGPKRIWFYSFQFLILVLI